MSWQRCSAVTLCALSFFIIGLNLGFYLTAQSSIRGIPLNLLRNFVRQNLEEPDSCFKSFHRLLKSYNVSGKFFFVEPKPPIPVGEVDILCRHRLVPKRVPVTETMLKCYGARYSELQRSRIRDSLWTVKMLFDKNKIPLILVDGSMIGSLRYHNMIPYDDDFDFRVPNSDKFRTKRLLRELSSRDPRFIFSDTEKKLGHDQMKIACLKKAHCASFMDFFYYSLHGDKMRIPEWPHTISKSIFFPLIKRPLEGQIYDALGNFNAFFNVFYKTHSAKSQCVSVDHNRQLRKECPVIECSDLNILHPFVVKSHDSKAHLELVVNASHISSIFYYLK